MAKVSVIGAGSWGTALAILLNNNGHDVTVWYHNNKAEIPGAVISEKITYTQDLESAVRGQDLIVMAVSSTHVRAEASQIKGFVSKGQVIVDVAKGIEEGNSDAPFTDNRTGDSTGGRCSPFGTFTCGRSRMRRSYYDCCWSTYCENSKVYSGYLYE